MKKNRRTDLKENGYRVLRVYVSDKNRKKLQKLQLKLDLPNIDLALEYLIKENL